MNVLSLSELQKAAFLGSGDVHFGRLCASADDPKIAPDVAIAAAVTSRFLSQGHPCVPLEELGSLLVPDDEGRVVGQLPSVDRLRDVLSQSQSASFSPVNQQETPLVVDEAERIYVARYFDHERRLAVALARLITTTLEVSVPPTEWLGDRLDHYFPPQDEGEDLQRLAAQRALESPLTVISGGPGTGKTSTVVKILALLFEDAERHSQQPPVVRLLAPTGKAAARMMEATGSAFERLAVPNELVANVQEALTIHRALGVIPGNATRFVRGPEHPLRADVVLVDEASMVDLALMRHLLEALQPTARLILLGDRYQLASVEAGSVLSELCLELSREKDASQLSVELTKSYRFSAESGIAALAEAVRAGDVSASQTVLASSRGDLGHDPSFDEPADSKELRKLTVERYGAALRKKTPQEVLAAFSGYRILCAHRRGTFGVEHVNELVASWLLEAGMVPAQRSVGSGVINFYRGRLILVTENDYGVGLYNGDVGLVWPGDDGQMSVFFETDAGALREIPPAKLPAHETAFALTIHKSQGSEYDDVAVVLPQANSPLLTRELLYTAVTRAKKNVAIFGALDSVKAAVEKTVTRHSGLSAALRVARKG